MTVAVAGSKGVLRVWDALANVGVRKTFGDRLKKVLGADVGDERRGDGLVRLVDESDGEVSGVY